MRQEAAVTPGELLADADLIDYTMGASEKDEEEAIGKAQVVNSAIGREQRRREDAKRELANANSGEDLDSPAR